MVQPKHVSELVRDDGAQAESSGQLPVERPAMVNGIDLDVCFVDLAIVRARRRLHGVKVRDGRTPSVVAILTLPRAFGAPCTRAQEHDASAILTYPTNRASRHTELRRSACAERGVPVANPGFERHPERRGRERRTLVNERLEHDCGARPAYGMAGAAHRRDGGPRARFRVSQGAERKTCYGDRCADTERAAPTGEPLARRLGGARRGHLRDDDFAVHVQTDGRVRGRHAEAQGIVARDVSRQKRSMGQAVALGDTRIAECPASRDHRL